MPKPNKERLKVIIADDDLKLSDTLKDILVQKGFTVCAVTDGNQLLDTLKEDPHFNIIILDLIMPQKGGLPILGAIKSNYPNIPVVVYTGFEEYKDSSYVRLADAFLSKSLGPDELIKVINKLLTK